MSKQELIRQITESLEEENNLNVPFMISVIDQQIELYEEFYGDILRHNFKIGYYTEDKSGGYTNGKIEIFIEKPDEEKESEYLVDTYYDHHYTIEFVYDERMWGYCMCEPGDEGYNEKHHCCGNGCDWYAPAIYVNKVIDYGRISWNGNEADYWEYEENFYNSSEELKKQKEKEEKESRIQYIEKEIDRLKVELLNLHKED